MPAYRISPELPTTLRQPTAPSLQLPVMISIRDSLHTRLHFPLISAKKTRPSTLMRFYLPDGSMVSPMEFIPILEEDGTIAELEAKWCE